MRFCPISISLITFCLRSLAVNSFGELVIFRQSPLKPDDHYTLTCMTRIQHAALVWNDDLRLSNPRTDEIPPKNTIGCANAGQDGCSVQWETKNKWNVVNSMQHPMGPVFDSRWEEFEELDYKYQHISNVSRSGAVVFSARGLGDINVDLCEEATPSESSCFSITIPAWPNQTSLIRPCFNRDIGAGELSQDPCESEQNVENNQSTIDASEWRTFTVTWDENRREIEFYSHARMRFKKEFTSWRNISHLFVQSSHVGRIRFHFYDYLLTQTNATKLTSVSFNAPSSPDFCFEGLVSLCSKCRLEIYVVDSNNRNKKRIHPGHRSKAADGNLPYWRVVKFFAKLEGFQYSPFTLEVFTILNQNISQGRWAIGSFRKCAPMGTFKFTKTVPQSWNLTSSSLSSIGCQQLAYGRNAVLKSNGPINHTISSELQECERGLAGPSCEFECTESCKGTSVCIESGCICSQGFEGDDCKTECPAGKYGYNCQKTCGSCKSGICDKITGVCGSNCERYYLPPRCEIELTAPVVIPVSETTVLLNYLELPVELVQDIHFQIEMGGQKWDFVTFSTSISPTRANYTAKITRLSLETLYTVRAVINTRQGITVESPERNFTTYCPALAELRALAVLPPRDNNIRNNDLTLRGYHHIPRPDATKYTITFKVLKTRLRNDQSLHNLSSGFYGEINQFYHMNTYWCTHWYPCWCTDWSIRVYLPASTQYRIFVRAEKSCGSSTESSVDYSVPTKLGFASEEKLEVNRIGHSIELRLPSVMNETWNTVITVIVKGSPTCRSSPVPHDLRNILRMTASEEGWVAVTFEDPKNRPESWTIGQVANDENSKNCRIDPEKTYVIVVVAFDKIDGATAVIKSSPIYPNIKEQAPTSIDINTYLHGLLILMILLICFMLLYMYRRTLWNKLRRVRRRDVVSYSQGFVDFVKSTTTCPFEPPPTSPAGSRLPSTFQTVVWSRYSHSVNIEDFEDYVKDSIANGLLNSQFLMLPKGLNRPCRHGSRNENTLKNRYMNIIAYDSSRVILKKTPEDRCSDYINANYVPGFRQKKAYIAAQGPKPQTVVDFWRMVWQEKAPVICMLANVVEGKRPKCEQYWPEFGDSKTYGDIVVVTESHRVFTDYTLRTFRVSCKEESRKVEHLHYTGWPDHTVPMYTKYVIAYLKKLQNFSTEKAPIIVHCSAGVGRTGTIILCDICIRQAITKGTINALATFKKLRDSRPNMVDNEMQYIFAHLVLVEYLLSPSTELPCNNDLRTAIEMLKIKLPQHMKRLHNTTWQGEALHPQPPPRPPISEQLAKNRFPELAPVSSGLVYLKRYPTNDNNSDYISAVIVDGPRVQKQFLSSQLPLPSTLSDFWRLITEQTIELVVILQQPDSNDPTCCVIIPDEEPLNPVPFINVESTSSTASDKSPKIDELLLTYTSGVTAESQRVTVLTCSDWGLGKNGKPPPPEKLVELWMTSENIRRNKGPTLVLCHDGIRGCGLYLALCFLLERMAVEKECDVIFAVQAIRRARPDFVQTQEQFEYLYDAAMKYAESFNT